MASVILFVVFSAFYMLYNTSKKAILNSFFGFENWITNNAKTGKLLGLSILVTSCFISCMHFGIGVGVLYFFITLMTLGSLIIVLNPIKLLNPKSVCLLFGISLMFEFLVLN